MEKRENMTACFTVLRQVWFYGFHGEESSGTTMRDIDDFPFWKDRLRLPMITGDRGDVNALDLRTHPGSSVTLLRQLAVRVGGLVLKHCA